MRILVHSIFYRPELPGVAKYTAEMCEWLVSRGHEVDVVCPPPYYPQWKVEPPYRPWRYRREKLGGVAVIRCPIWMPAQPGGVQRILYAASFAISSLPVMLAKVFRRPDVVFVVEPSFLNVAASLAVAKLTGALSWLHIQDFEIDMAFKMGQLRNRWLRSVLRRLELFLMRRFDAVSTISRAMVDVLRSKGVAEDRVVLFPNWVDTSVIQPMPEPSPLRAELGIDPATVVVLFSGTLGAKQGLETLLAAAEELHHRRGLSSGRLLFLICGDGPESARLRAASAGLPNVRFIPLQPAERLNSLLNAADIHVLPQVPDVADSVMPSKLLGMLASGRSIVATVSEQSEVGRHVRDCGVVVPPGDAKALADALESLEAEPKRRAALGAEARRRATEALRHDRILGAFDDQLERLQRLMGGHRRRTKSPAATAGQTIR